MLNYIIRRLLIGLVTLLGITFVTFLTIESAPGDIVELMLWERPDATDADRERLRESLGLNDPMAVRYAMWVGKLLTLDFGESIKTGEPVTAMIKRHIWPTASVGIISLALAFLLSIPIGLYSAVRQGGAFDRIMSTNLYMLYSVPSYVIGMVLILYLGVKHDWFPIQGRYSDNYEELSAFGKFADLAHHYVLITICFTAGSLAYYSRFVRQNLLEVVQQDFIRTARAKGLPERRVIIHHAFRNTLIPFVSLLGLTLPFILSGSVILEHMFNWPGIGWLYMESVMSRDVNAIMGLNFMTAALVLICTLLADLAYGLVDPRISHD